jgi:predicted transport protein
MKGGFNDSPIRLNEFLRKVDVWNKEEIELRAKKLADKAKQIWFAPKLPQEILIKYKPVEKVATTYSIEDHEHLKGEMFELYQALKKRILNIDSSVKEEFKKLYIAFKSSTNFVDIIPQKVRLLLELNIDFQDIIDPKGLCRDVSGLGRWGNGDVEVIISKIDELDDVMELIQQAFDKQLESV